MLNHLIMPTDWRRGIKYIFWVQLKPHNFSFLLKIFHLLSNHNNTVWYQPNPVTKYFKTTGLETSEKFQIKIKTSEQTLKTHRVLSFFIKRTESYSMTISTSLFYCFPFEIIIKTSIFSVYYWHRRISTEVWRRKPRL